VTRRKISVLLISLILLSVIIVKDLSLERKDNQKGSEKQTVSLNEHEIAEKVNKKIRSSFFENQGQMDNQEIIYYGSLPNGKIAFGESKVLLWADGMNDIITINFVGARKISPFGLDELITKSNYFLGDRGTFTNVKSFGAVLYEELWCGIDLYYKATPEGVKYEFRVAPDANPEDICINCEGSEQLNIGKDSVTIVKGEGRFIDEGLLVYQEKHEIDAKFIAKGSNAFGFQINNYNPLKPLIIDPLIYSTFVGGSEDDYGYSIALDSSGNAYVTGNTMSMDFPTTSDAYNESSNGGYCDCFVFKLSANGSDLIYSTFVGGSLDDYGISIALDNTGNAFVTGRTGSSNFPTTLNAYNRTHGGYYDCFVFKLSANGSSLIYSTFIGRSDGDGGGSIALDSEGNAYVTGYTSSNDFPTTTNAYDESYNGGYCDCFVLKLSTNGSTLHYSTFVGGSNVEGGGSITLDNEGNAYVTCTTTSNDFPTTANAYDTTFNGGVYDCIVFKLSENGSTLHYSTFIGGNGDDYKGPITLDSAGNAYVIGFTGSSDFPTTANAYDTTFNGGNYDCFIFKLSANSSSLLYSTLIGGEWDDKGHSIALDSENNIYATGYTGSSDFPTTTNAYNRILNGGGDCFVFKLSANCSILNYATFIGGSSFDHGYTIALDDVGDAYVTGETHSTDFPTTSNAYNRTSGGNDDCIVFKITIEDAPIQTPTLTPITGLEKGLIFSLVFVSMMVMCVYRRKRK